jgi:predicted HicB family RNase H-like nuclease
MRPKHHDKQLLIRLTQELKDKIMKCAEKQKISSNALIRQVLEIYTNLDLQDNQN